MCHNNLDRFENWITRLICYGYREGYTNLKEYF